MAVKKIIWSKRAKTELNETLEFYLERNGSPDYSLKIILRLESLTNTLTKNYFIGRLTSNKSTRVIPMENFLIFYDLGIDFIEIVSFWDNRQDISKRLDH